MCFSYSPTKLTCYDIQGKYNGHKKTNKKTNGDLDYYRVTLKVEISFCSSLSWQQVKLTWYGPHFCLCAEIEFKIYYVSHMHITAQIVIVIPESFHEKRTD